MSRAKVVLALTWGAVLALSPAGAFAYTSGRYSPRGYHYSTRGHGFSAPRPNSVRKAGQSSGGASSSTANAVTSKQRAMPKIAAQQEAIFYGAAMTWIKNNQGSFRADWRYPGPVVLSDGSSSCALDSAYKTVNLKANGTLPGGWSDPGARAYCAALFLNIDGKDRSALVLYSPGVAAAKQTQLTATQTTGAMADGMLNSKAVSTWFPSAMKGSSPLVFSAFKAQSTNRWVIYKPLSGTVTHASQVSGSAVTQQTAQTTQTTKQTLQASNLPAAIKTRLISAFNGSGS